MAERLYVYNAKVSIRSRLEILQTIRAKLSWKEDRLDIFSWTVFGPWLNIQTTLHDNHLLNFLLQHQRFFSKPSTNQPFIFDIDGRTLEYGMEDFCLITGFRFGKVNLDPNEEDHYEFRMRVFPKIENLKGEHLLVLVNKDVKFAKLDDEDAVRVCLLLALDFVFMGHELRHVVSKPIRVYNVAVTHRKFHLEKLASNPKYKANYVLYGFVFPLKIWGLETFSNSIHWWRKDENVIPRGVAWSNGLKFEKSSYDKFFYSEKSTINKLIPSAIEMNELWWRSSLDYFKKVNLSTLVLRSATKDSSKGKSVHTRVRIEVRHEVHVCTEVSRVHSKEEVHVPAVEKKDIHERDELLKIVKEQKQMILDLQLRINSVEEKLKPGSSDVDHLDKTDNLSKNAPDCGLDQQSNGGVSQCMNVDEPYKNWNDVSDNFHGDGHDHNSVEGVRQYTGLNDEYENVAVDGLISLQSQDFVDSPQVKVNDNEEACHSDDCLSTQQDDVNVNSVAKEEIVKDDVNVDSLVKEEIVKDDVNVDSLVKDEIVKDDVNIDSLVKEDIEKDDVNVDSLVKEDIEKDDVHVDSFVKEDIEKDDVQFDSVVNDAVQIENETLQLQKFPGKALLSPFIQPPSTEVKYRKRHCETQLKVIKSVYGSDGVEIKLLPWKEDVTRSPTAPKRTVSVPEAVNMLFRDKNRMEMKWTFPWEPNANWAMASPYLCDMLSRYHFPLYCADGVYFPINENDSHWVLGELHISSGLITIYDSLGCPPNGIETHLFWLDLMDKLQFHFLLFLDNAEVFEKKNIVKDEYSISFKFADGVPIQGGLYGDCGVWVCIFLYRLLISFF
ncbi:ulp1 protease family, C-terminal catalytic domain-containing protein [Tanacetum coccineum]